MVTLASARHGHGACRLLSRAMVSVLVSVLVSATASASLELPPCVNHYAPSGTAATAGMTNMVLAYMDSRSVEGPDRTQEFVWNASMFETLLAPPTATAGSPAAGDATATATSLSAGSPTRNGAGDGAVGTGAQGGGALQRPSNSDGASTGFFDGVLFIGNVWFNNTAFAPDPSSGQWACCSVRMWLSLGQVHTGITLASVHCRSRLERMCAARVRHSPLPWLLGVLACCCAAPGPATQSDWLQLLELFLSMGAVQLDRAAAAVQPRPKHAPKVQFVLSIPTPDPRAVRWGTSAAGRPLNMSVEADRVAAAAWYVTLRKCQLLYPATPYYPFPRVNIHTMGNIWSFTVG